MENTVDISQLSAEELEKELALRKANAKKEEKGARDLFVKDKQDFTYHTASKFKSLQEELTEVKNYTIREANKLFERMYAINNRQPKEIKSFSLKNEEDTIKVTVDRQERFEFTEEATVHIGEIKEIFREKFAKRNKGLYNLLDGLLIKSKGDYDPKLLAKARKQVRELGDSNLIIAFDKLEDCQRVVGSSLYCRLYVRDENKKWKDISLQFSSL